MRMLSTPPKENKAINQEPNKGESKTRLDKDYSFIG